ncbi:MAG: DUF3095 domain-containing protein [Balneolaceae bacterium]|nr:DUF3095 domain-containing protein [Balneolaceae bacterium]
MGSEDSHTFYSDLPLLESFFEISNSQNFHALPDEWYVAVTDIVNSTRAIQHGEYKKVNILGASPIVGILNLSNKNNIPYTFGGDGCTLCIPPALLDDTRNVLGASRQIGKRQYELDLRAAIISMRDIREAGHEIKVARYKVSDVYNQAIFSGSGLSFAEKTLKQDENEKYRITAAGVANGTDFTGLECRWQEVGQEKKKVITMLIRSNPTLENSDEIYKNVLEKMRSVFGFDDKTNPIHASQLNMNMSLTSLMGEIEFRTFGMSWLQRLLYVLKIEAQIVLGKIFMSLGYKSSATNWSIYKRDLALNSDHRKFDDMLRAVISGTEEQFQKLTEFLEEQHEAGLLAYGFHISDTAIITCMVFRYQQEHVHFVDGSEGGYVKAAQNLKQRISELNST